MHFVTAGQSCAKSISFHVTLEKLAAFPTGILEELQIPHTSVFADKKKIDVIKILKGFTLVIKIKITESIKNFDQNSVRKSS